MHITKLYIGYQPPLEDVDFQCDERVNLFVGPNASGKSTILRGIMGLHSLALKELYDDYVEEDDEDDEDDETTRTTRT